MSGKPGMNNKLRDLPPIEEVPREARHTYKGLVRWLKERRDRGVPGDGYHPEEKFHSCSQSCILHDHDS